MNIQTLSLKHGFEYLPKDINGRVVNIYNIKSCRITGVNCCYPNALLYSSDDSQLYLPVNEQTMSLKSKTIYHEHNMIYEYHGIESTGMCEYPVFFFIYNVENYYHFLYDSLPILITYFHLKQDIPKIKIMINYPPGKNEFYKFVLETFELLGILDDLVIVDKHITYPEVYVSDSYTHNGMSNEPPRTEIYQIYNKLIDEALTKHSNVAIYDKIYISRRTWVHNDYSNIGTNYTTRRKLVNEDELVHELTTSCGVQEIFTEQLTMVEKIKMFYNADMVIGAIGGGLSNVVFSKPNTKLIAMISPTFLDVNWRFRYCLSRTNINFMTCTKHVEPGEYKTYMRVKTNTGVVGEIQEIKGDMLCVSYCKTGGNVGWSSGSLYETMYINKNKVKRLDDGLNSPWGVDISVILSIV